VRGKKGVFLMTERLLTTFPSVLAALVFTGCTEKPGGEVRGPLRESTEIVCPVHRVTVVKVEAFPGIACYAWDPKIGLTVDQLRNRFPYAVWDSNIHQLDESPGATIPRYNLVCDRCMASWREYAEAAVFSGSTSKFVISVTAADEVLINGTEFTIEQLPAIAKVASTNRTNPRLYLQAHQSASTEQIRSVVKACGEGGIQDVIFGSYEESPSELPK